MSEDDVTRTTISMSPETRDRLKALGRKGETYDELLNRLIDTYLRLDAHQEPEDDAPGDDPRQSEVDFEPV